MRQPTRSIGWQRVGSRGRFRYLDADGRRVEDEGALEHIRVLGISPARKDVWISRSSRSKIQATRGSRVSFHVVEQYLDGRTLDPEETATLTLLRSWRIRSSRAAA